MLAENQKKLKVATVNAAPLAASSSMIKTNGFKISVVDENGMKNGEFSDISHLKFETAKGGKPKHLMIPTSKEE